MRSKKASLLALCLGAGLCLSLPMQGRAQPEPTPAQAVAAYRASIRQTLNGDHQLAELIARSDFEATTFIVLEIAPDGSIIRQTFTGFGQDPKAEMAVMNYVEGFNFGPFPPEMPDRPIKYILPISSG